jgi:hypothetical protein
MSDIGYGMGGNLPQTEMLNGISNPTNPAVASAKQSAAEAMAFQLWVAEQAHNLSKLKVFQEMAKKVNDS